MVLIDTAVSKDLKPNIKSRRKYDTKCTHRERVSSMLADFVRCVESMWGV